MSKSALRCGVGVAGAALVLSIVPPTSAAAPDDSAEQGGERELAPVNVTLDASGSMAQRLDNGQTRMDEAKQALRSLVDGLGPNSEMGLQVYGSQTSNSPEDKAAGCQDIVTEQPVGEVEPNAFKRRVDGIEPSGHTPIGNALREAADALPDDGPGGVVLISDGLDTCAPPNPCDVAEQLASDGVDLTVHTVGFRVGDQAREQLSCVAENTGGTYTDAQDADSLDEQLPEVVKRAQRSYEAQGTPITGTPDYPEAPEASAGQYVDQIDTGELKYYRLRIPEGFTVHTAATVIAPKDETSGTAAVETRVVDAQGQQCESEAESEVMWHSHVTSALTWQADDSSSCSAGETMYLSVERSGPDEPENWTWDMELLVALEPPVTGDTGPPANEAEMPFEHPGDDAQQVTGGGSFNDATELDGSGAYRDELVPGEMATYKVWLDWGEALAVKTNLDSRRLDGLVYVQSGLFGPTRHGGGASWSDRTAMLREQDSMDGLATSRVLYDNREESGIGPNAAMAGWHYITLTAEPNDDVNGTMPARFYVAKDGQKIDGPEYAEVDGLPSGPITSQEQLGGAGTSGQNQQGPGSDQRTEDVADAATQNSGVPVWAWVTIGSALAVGLLVGLLLLRRYVARQ